MNDGVSLTAVGDLNWSVIQAIPTIPTILVNQRSSQSAPLREFRKRLRDGPQQKSSRAIMALSLFNSPDFKMSLLLQLQQFSSKTEFLIQRTTNLIYLTSQLFLLFCIIKKDRGILALSWKIWPPRVGCRDHFGPQAEFSVWNTVSPTERCQPLIWRSKIWRLSLFHYPLPLTVNPKPLLPQQIDPAQIGMA